MALWNQIGPFPFLDLRGGIERFKQEVEILARPGVNGAGFKQLGLKGRPFNCHSRVDAESVQDAQLAWENYSLIVGDGNAYYVAQYGTDFTIFGVQFIVLDVRLVTIKAMALFQGGIFPPSQGWIEAEWTLFPIST